MRREFAAFNLHQYVGAYGPCLSQLETVLSNPQAGQSFVDELEMSLAYGSDLLESTALVAVLKDLKIRSALDIAFGGGEILRSLALNDPAFLGAGIDANSNNVRAAKKKAQYHGVDQRISYINGDFREIIHDTDSWLSTFDPEVVIGANVLNAFCFEPDHIDLVAAIASIRRRYPRRLLVIHDYYPALTSLKGLNSSHKSTLLQDVAQMISGQGLPPASKSDWEIIYQSASCQLIHEFDIRTPCLNTFIHLVQL